MSRPRRIVVRVSEAEEAQIRTRAEAAGQDVSAWLRGLALAEVEADGRSGRWRAFRASVATLLGEQPDSALYLLLETPSAGARVGALRIVAHGLGLDRQLSPQEAGIVWELAQAERARRAQ